MPTAHQLEELGHLVLPASPRRPATPGWIVRPRFLSPSGARTWRFQTDTRKAEPEDFISESACRDYKEIRICRVSKPHRSHFTRGHRADDDPARDVPPPVVLENH
jgi:hypothetical protein